MCYILITQYPPFCSLVRKQKACANEQNHVCKDSSTTECTLFNRWVGTWQKSVKAYFLDVITVLLFSLVSYVKMYSHWN